MQSLIIFSALVVSAFSFAYRPGGGRGWGGPVDIIASRRDAGAESTADVYALIQSTLDKAREGITAQDLDTAVQSIKQSVDEIIDANGGKADAKKVHALIFDIAKHLDGATAISSLFDDPLGFEASKLDSALHLLDRLMAKGKELEAEGESNNEVLGAISMTAEAIDQSVTQAVNIVLTLTEDQQDVPESDMRKRWEFTGDYKYGPGGPSYNLGIEHSWKRMAMSKRKGWKGGLKAGYGPGGYTVGGSVSYSWGR